MNYLKYKMIMENNDTNAPEWLGKIMTWAIRLAIIFLVVLMPITMAIEEVGGVGNFFIIVIISCAITFAIFGKAFIKAIKNKKAIDKQTQK